MHLRVYTVELIFSEENFVLSKTLSQYKCDRRKLRHAKTHFFSENSCMDDDGGDGLGSRLRWKALQNETLYVEVSGVRAAIGDYRFLLTESSDDHGNNASTATGIELGSIVEGVFDSDIDIDWFRFAAPASGVYRAAVDHGALIITTSPDGQSLKPPSPVASLEAMAGEEVYVRVDGTHAAKRPYALTLHSLVDEHGDSVDDATANYFRADGAGVLLEKLDGVIAQLVQVLPVDRFIELTVDLIGLVLDK